MDNHTLPTNPPRKPRPGQKRIVTGHRAVPMHVSHLPGSEPRCSKCWLRNPKPGHGCAKNLGREPSRDKPPMVFVPIYAWV